MVVDKTGPKESSTSQATSSARKGSRTLPPPSELYQPVSSIRASESVRVQAPVPEPRSRASSQASTMSTSSRKPVPPVPKKPALLTKSSGRQVSQETGTKRTVSTLPPPIQRIPSDGPKGAFPPPPRRTSEAAPIPSPRQQPPLVSSFRPLPTDPDGPPLPPRRTSVGDKSCTNDFMDDDNDGASAIPSLQPTRRP